MSETKKVLVTKEDFFAYEEVRLSGITNMYNVKLVSELTNLTREQIKDIMKNYEEYANKYLDGKEEIP